jgi:hypothetical protein
MLFIKRRCPLGIFCFVLKDSADSCFVTFVILFLKVSRVEALGVAERSKIFIVQELETQANGEIDRVMQYFWAFCLKCAGFLQEEN